MEGRGGDRNGKVCPKHMHRLGRGQAERQAATWARSNRLQPRAGSYGWVRCARGTSGHTGRSQSIAPEPAKVCGGVECGGDGTPHVQEPMASEQGPRGRHPIDCTRAHMLCVKVRSVGDIIPRGQDPMGSDQRPHGHPPMASKQRPRGRHPIDCGRVRDAMRGVAVRG